MLEAKVVHVLFTSNNNIRPVGAEKQTGISSKRGFQMLRWPVAANTVASSQVEGFVHSTGCLSTYAQRVVLSHQLHQGLGGRL